MIRNIVFDMGNVLILFDPEYFMDLEGITEAEDRKIIRRELFHNTEWAQMDLGVLTEETAAVSVLERVPERLKGHVLHLLNHWWEQRQCIPGMPELLGELKKAGYRLFLLSNASISQHMYWPKFEISKVFEGKMISCDVFTVKPAPEIYRMFTDKFALLPEECLFIDDLPANVAGAVSCGWKGIVFQGDAGDLRQRLRKQGIQL